MNLEGKNILVSTERGIKELFRLCEEQGYSHPSLSAVLSHIRDEAPTKGAVFRYYEKKDYSWCHYEYDEEEREKQNIQRILSKNINFL